MLSVQNTEFLHVKADGTYSCYRLYMHQSRPALGPTQPPIQWVPVYPTGKAAGVWRWPPPHLAPRLKKE